MRGTHYSGELAVWSVRGVTALGSGNPQVHRRPYRRALFVPGKREVPDGDAGQTDRLQASVPAELALRNARESLIGTGVSYLSNTGGPWNQPRVGRQLRRAASRVRAPQQVGRRRGGRKKSAETSCLLSLSLLAEMWEHI